MERIKYSSLIHRTLLCVLCLLLISSCSHEDDIELVFIGDSNIERWDLGKFFPSFITENYGASNSGIQHIEEYAGRFRGKRVVVLTGINDHQDYEISSIDLDNYIHRYVSAVNSLMASKIYVFSALPVGKEHSENYELVNFTTCQLNECLREQSRVNGWVYFDVYSILLQGEGVNPNYSLDGKHPNDRCYEILTKLLIQNL
ncbi:MAG: hypothetical protein K5778_02620 [Bacteroidaceae bacterium]|nr:hypothetical protein [Bacteroidaceae bacterium]